ncbi:MAG: uridine phosphorylase [Candidatus Eremiobacteraeota bacterium]|nr:uridine phosphorylase [Candidatus Eremiobacteraeota bacterium]
MKKGKEYHIALGKGDVGKYVILPGDPGRVPLIAGYLENSKKVAENREYTTYTGTLDGIKVAVTSTGIGCPSAAICLEELIKIGADTFIRVGTAGALQPSVGLGDLVIATGAIREEGTTRQYIPLSYPAVADFDVTLALREAAKKLGYKHHMGVCHCKDAFYIEGEMEIPHKEHNQALWKAWERANVLATSMEDAALFVVSQIRRVRAGEVLAIIGLTYKDAPIMKKVGIDEAIKTAMEAIRILHGQEKKKK